MKKPKMVSPLASSSLWYAFAFAVCVYVSVLVRKGEKILVMVLEAGALEARRALVVEVIRNKT